MATEVMPTNSDVTEQPHLDANSSGDEQPTDVAECLAKCSVEEKAVAKQATPERTSESESIDPADAKQRKKLDKLIDGLLRKQQCRTLDDKYYALAAKFVTLQDENKQLQS